MQALGGMLAIVAGAMAVQLIPLPAPFVDWISPAERRTWQQLYLVVPHWLPTTIDPRSSAWAAAVGAAGLVVFIAAYRLLGSGSVRQVIRGISVIGLIVSAIGIAQDATGRGLMYWFRAPLQEGAPPFGPFVDRNSFATWVLLAVPLCLGYLAAHLRAHHRHQTANAPWGVRLRLALDARLIWLTAAVTLMLVGLFATLSRSGISSLAVVIVLGTYLHSRRQTAGRHQPSWIAAACALAVVLAVARIDPVILGRRFVAARASAADRAAIWRETVPILRDFWLTGTGVGTYETAMLVYQRSSPGVRFNQAHNHYLQVAAEGGMLVGIPVAIALWLYVGVAAHKIDGDQTSMYWVRAGALCGLAAVAAQSFWDTGLTAPANAILAALSASIVVHSPGESTPPNL
jgi:O-antigen ligase